MSVQGFILRLEQERAGLIQSIFDYSNAVQQWRGDLVTLDAVLELLRSGEVPEVPTNTDPVGELPAPPAGEVVEEHEEVVEEEVVEDVEPEPEPEQPAPVDDTPVGQPSEPEQPEQVPAEPEPVESSAPAAEEPVPAPEAEPAPDAPADEVSTEASTTEDDSAR